MPGVFWKGWTRNFYGESEKVTFGQDSETGDSTLRALLIRHPWIDLILNAKKVWEIRGSRTLFRETIGLVPSGSGAVVGVCDLVDCIGPLTAEQFCKNAKKAGMRPSEAKLGWYRQTYAWVVEKPRYLKHPVPYRHPSGAVIWVRLDTRVEREILEQRCGRGRR
jgi:hypothetical protein